MSSKSEQNWNRPWGTEDIIKYAEKWSLAGDAALLNTIEAFSDTLLSKTAHLSDKIDSMLNNLEQAGLKLDLSQNEFQSLRNTQFMESRVYEDDETLDSKEEKAPETVLTEENQDKEIVESIKRGMEIMEKYYDKVEVSISDSEDETERSYVLQPKDFYAHRPLPPVIGTEDWYKKWYLDDVSSESESGHVSEIYSESDSEDDLPKDLVKGSETSSELEFSSHLSENRPVANSTFNDSQKSELSTSSEENDKIGSLPVKAQLSSELFAEQLAAKLGNIVSEQEEQINKNPIQPNRSNILSSDLYFDEPPPLEEPEDSVLAKNIQSGLFSGGQGLFDDQDEVFLDDDRDSKLVKKNVHNDEIKSKKVLSPSSEENVNTSLPKSLQLGKGLFDSDDSSDDDIFAVHHRQLTKQPFLQHSKVTVPLFDEEPPALDTSDVMDKRPVKKKPTGGVSIFGSVDLFQNKNLNIVKNESKQITVTDKNANPATDVNTTKLMKNQPNMMNTNQIEQVDILSEVEENKIAAKPSVKPKQSSIFDDDDELSENIDNLKTKKSGVVKESLSKSNIKSKNIITEAEQTEDIFGVIPSLQPKQSSLFDEDEISGDINNPKIQTSDLEAKGSSNSNKVSLFDTENVNIVSGKPNKKISLFDEDDELFQDELFSDVTSKLLSSNLFDDTDNHSIFEYKGGKPNASSNKAEDFVEETLGIKTENDVYKVDEQIRNYDRQDTKSNKLVETVEHEDHIFNIPDENIEIAQKAENISPPSSINDDEAFADPSTKSKKKIGLFVDSDDEDSLFKIESKKIPEPIQDITGSNKTKNCHKISEIIIREEEVIKSAGKSDVKTSHNSFGDLDRRESLSQTEDIKSNLVSTSAEESKISAEQHNNGQPVEATKSNIVDPVHIDLFGSSPPPDDGEIWDTKSDSLSEADDFSSYHADDHFRSNIFDNEPPSLEPDDSSGIVRDYNTTRTDTEYSFEPQTSSSRRFSTDIFKDQHSQDSFFVTKNLSAPLPPGTTTFETSKNSTLDITPSGDPKDFDTTEVDTKSIDISKFKEEGNTSMFLAENMDKKEIERISIGSCIKGTDRNTEQKDRDVKNGNPERISDKQLQTSVKDKINTFADMSTSEPENEAVVTKNSKGPPGKLKHNLNINVNALRPTFGFPKFSELPKSQSLDIPQDEPDSSTLGSVHAPSIKKSTSEKAISFDEPVKHVEVLHNITKDRAKISIKRRPSTRRGRQEAIRKSAMDLDVQAVGESDQFSNNILNVDESKVVDKHHAITSEVENEFTVQDNVVKDSATNKNTYEKSSELFSEAKSVIDILSNSSQNLPVKTKSFLFDSEEEESESDLFSQPTKKNKSVSTAEHDKSKKGQKPSKKFLFEDSSSEDDLFSETTRSAKSKVEHTKGTNSKTVRTSALNKIHTTETDEDPLSGLLK